MSKKPPIPRVRLSDRKKPAKAKSPVRRVRLHDDVPAKLPKKLQQVARADDFLDPLGVETVTRLAKRWHYNPTSLWRLEETGVLPRRVRMSPGRRAWRHTDLKAWLDSLTPD